MGCHNNRGKPSFRLGEYALYTFVCACQSTHLYTQLNLIWILMSCMCFDVVSQLEGLCVYSRLGYRLCGQQPCLDCRVAVGVVLRIVLHYNREHTRPLKL